MASAKVTKAFLSSNLAVFEVPAGPEWQPGRLVTVAGCTTSAFNGNWTCTTGGVFSILDTDGVNADWSGLSVPITNANIPAEVESGATITF